MNVLTDYVGVDYDDTGRATGMPLVERLQTDWKIFSAETDREALLAEILKGTAADDRHSLLGARDLVIPFHLYAHSTATDYWLRACGWMNVSPYEDSKSILDSMLSEDPQMVGGFVNRLGRMLERYARVVPAGTSLYRARAGFETTPEGADHPFSGEDLGPNPSYPYGRANVDGNPVVYCAEAEATAVAEVRPARGFLVSVVELKISRDVRVIDLFSPPQRPNPFTTRDLPWVLDLDRLFGQLSWWMAEPTSHGEDRRTYLRTQLVAELSRKHGYDGIRYGSALDYPSGRNLALFFPDSVTVHCVAQVVIESTAVQYRREENSEAGVA